MNRAMFSGVAGLKTHQTKMDVIGNNIANVNTYGYKTQTAIFSDLMYQNLRGASQSTSARGGTNPSSVGYGSQLMGVRTQMSTSSMQSTGFSTDVACTGEGFLQVMDPDGNIYYTKAGMLDVDASGYLVDMNGNFVLGSATADGTPDTQKLKVDNIGAVEPAFPTVTEPINGIDWTISASNAIKDGNVSISFGSGATLPAGLDMKATIESTGGITIAINPEANFASLAALNTRINEAITEANGGVQHKGGNFTIESNPPITGAITGEQLVSQNFGVKTGSITGFKPATGYGMSIKGVGTDFLKGVTPPATSAGVQQLGAAYSAADNMWTITMRVEGEEYIGKYAADTKASSVLLKRTGGESGDYVEVTLPTGLPALADPPVNIPNVNLMQPAAGTTGGSNGVAGTATPSTPSDAFGLTLKGFTLTGGTEGGTITLDELTSITVGKDGTVTVSHPEKGTVIAGKISLANFANPGGLESAGTNYYSATVNSGEPILCDPGSDGTGALQSSALEMSNVDLSGEMADMITTQRGFQANSRIITVSDTMLEELINLKR